MRRSISAISCFIIQFFYVSAQACELNNVDSMSHKTSENNGDGNHANFEKNRTKII